MNKEYRFNNHWFKTIFMCVLSHKFLSKWLSRGLPYKLIVWLIDWLGNVSRRIGNISVINGRPNKSKYYNGKHFTDRVRLLNINFIFKKCFEVHKIYKRVDEYKFSTLSYKYKLKKRIDWLVFYVISAIFQPCDGGKQWIKELMSVHNSVTCDQSLYRINQPQYVLFT